jgi:hypothetical protein
VSRIDPPQLPALALGNLTTSSSPHRPSPSSTPTPARPVCIPSAHIVLVLKESGFFPIAAEMRNPRLYTRSLLICQGAVTATYITVGTVIYYFCGSYVASPALGSSSVLIKKVSYGIALPGLVVSTIVVLHVCPLLLYNLCNYHRECIV